MLIIGEVHTIQAPYLNKSNFILVLAHHVKVKIKRASEDSNQTTVNGDPEEHIFALVLGFNPSDVRNLIDLLRIFWENPTTKLGPKDVGLTTRLFLAAALKVYGFKEAEKSVRTAFGKLEAIYEKLDDPRPKADKFRSGQKIRAEEETEEDKLKRWKKEYDEQIESCTDLSSRLMQMDKALPGVRSRIHFVGLCAQGLLRDESHMHRYIEDELERLGKKRSKGKTCTNNLLEQ